MRVALISLSLVFLAVSCWSFFSIRVKDAPFALHQARKKLQNEDQTKNTEIIALINESIQRYGRRRQENNATLRQIAAVSLIAGLTGLGIGLVNGARKEPKP